MFSLATLMEGEFNKLRDAQGEQGAFSKLLGDGRRLFSGQAVAMADVYLHSGFYPSIFDQREASGSTAVETEDDDHSHHKHDEHGNCVHEEDRSVHKHDENGKCIHEEDDSTHKHDEHGNCCPGKEDHHDDEHEKAMSFMGEARDPLDKLIRNFRVTEHSHLENGEEKEIIPWLKLAIELDPHAVDTYAVTSFWLRKNLRRVEDAREILRDGIRNNPTSPELLFAMGQIYEAEDKNPEKARNIWLAAKKFWEQQPAKVKEDSLQTYGKITVSLARLEKESGNILLAIEYFELTKLTSPNPDAIQRQIDELKSKQSPPAK